MTLYNNQMMRELTNCNDDNVDVETMMPMQPTFITLPGPGYLFGPSGEAGGIETTTLGTINWALH